MRFLTLCLFIALSLGLSAQSLRVHPKDGEQPRPGGELYYEAYVVNTTASSVVVFVGAALDYGGSRYTWRLTQDGKEVGTGRNFAQDTNSGFTKRNFKTLAPGDSLVLFVIRQKELSAGSYRLSATVDQNPATLKRGWGRATPEAIIATMSTFADRTETTIVVKDPDPIPFTLIDIDDSPEGVGKTTRFTDLEDAPFDPSKFFRVEYVIDDPATADSLLALISTLGNLRWLTINFKLPEGYELPATLFELPLTRLTLSTREAELRLPAALERATKLRSLTLTGSVTGLPDATKALELEELYLRDVPEVAAPAWITEMTGLRKLGITDARLKAVPAAIERLTELTFLSLHDTGITDLSPITSLTKLVSLNVPRGAVRELPVGIGQLSQLENIDLQGNALTALPAELGQLKQLKYLRLYDNQIADFPAAIYGATELSEISLSKNRLTVLPDGISALTKLRSLGLEDNLLTTLPADLGNNPALFQVNLKNNELKTLPPTLGTLKSQWASVSVQGNSLKGKDYKKVKEALSSRLKE